jgi:hypothetical protein
MLRLQEWKRITEPLADPTFMGGILSQTRAESMFRSPPDPMLVNISQNATFSKRPRMTDDRTRRIVKKR